MRGGAHLRPQSDRWREETLAGMPGRCSPSRVRPCSVSKTQTQPVGCGGDCRSLVKPGTEHTGDGPAAPRRVLVVEPDEKLRQRYCAAFVEAGWEVIESGEGRDAMTRALTSPPQLIVTEVALPLIDGFALCRVLRQDSLTACCSSPHPPRSC